MTFKEAYQKFTRNSTSIINNSKTVDVKLLIELIINEYSKTKIEGIDENNPDKDMLLFEYGNYDWTGKETNFNLSIKRQLFFENKDECGFYGFTIYYNTKKIGQIDSYSKWCIDSNSSNKWKSIIENTEGIKRVQNLQFEKIEFKLEKPH